MRRDTQGSVPGLDIQTGKHYVAFVVTRTETVRVDAVDGDEYVVFRVEVGMWWRLPSRRILRETRSPEEWAAIRATQRAESRLRVQETLRTMRERGTARAAPREVDYGIIHRQGTAFSPGDYGISREA